MGEIRLICPGCGAEYRLDSGLIPAPGRDVECSACGNTWHQAISTPANEPAAGRSPVSPRIVRQPVGATQTAAQPPRQTQLNRQLPADVLSILTEEAERERRARLVELEAARHKNEGWPATTVINAADEKPMPASEPAKTPDAYPQAAVSASGPASGADTSNDAPAARVSPLAGAATDARKEKTVPPEPVAEPRLTETAETARSAPKPEPAPEPTPKLPVVTTPAMPVAEVERRRGFRWALIVAALIVAIYLAAPLVPSDSGPGAVLADMRASLDSVRFWLAERIGTLIGRG